jgi:hypothetical protein
MSNSLPNTPSVPSNPVSSVTVTDISDCMPMCHENIPMLDMDDLLEPDMILEPIDDDEFDLDDLLEEVDRPEYCSQNGGDCSTCSLVNYGLDCMNNRVSKEVQHG